MLVCAEEIARAGPGYTAEPWSGAPFLEMRMEIAGATGMHNFGDVPESCCPTGSGGVSFWKGTWISNSHLPEHRGFTASCNPGSSATLHILASTGTDHEELLAMFSSECPQRTPLTNGISHPSPTPDRYPNTSSSPSSWPHGPERWNERRRALD